MLKTLTEFYKTRWYASLIIVFAVLAIYMLLEIKNNRFWMQDFQVYHTAAGRMIHGENLYRPDADGFYHYKYSAPSALLFVPFGILPFSAAKALYWLLLSAVICLGFYLAMLIVRPGFRTDHPRIVNNLILLSALILGVHIERELHLGQVNQLLLVMYLATIWLASMNKKLWAGLIWAASLFIKPFGLIFLPYFLIRRKFALVGWLFVFTAAFAILPLIFYSPGPLMGQYQNWFKEMSIELSGKQDLLANANHTIFSVLFRFTPLRLIPLTPTIEFVYQAALLILMVIFFLYLMALGRSVSGNHVMESAFILILIPLLSFTSQNAFGFVELAVFLIMFNFGELPIWTRVLAVVGFIFTGGNMHDIVGGPLWAFLNNISLLGIGAIILLFVLAVMRLRKIA